MKHVTLIKISFRSNENDENVTKLCSNYTKKNMRLNELTHFFQKRERDKKKLIVIIFINVFKCKTSDRIVNKSNLSRDI